MIYNKHTKAKLRRELETLEIIRTHCSVLGHDFESVETLAVDETSSSKYDRITILVECLTCGTTQEQIDYRRKERQYA